MNLATEIVVFGGVGFVIGFIIARLHKIYYKQTSSVVEGAK